MPFLLIGGHAVNLYGISRQTGDIDLLVQRSAKERWVELMSSIHYISSQSDNNFARFQPESIAAWPIDFMFVDDSTFEKMESQSTKMVIGVAEVKVVSARHLITLKIHALKHFQDHRFARDYNDLLSLLKSKNAAVSNAELKELCERYATLDLYVRLKKDRGE